MSGTGHVAALYRWPVKSFRGETVDSVAVGPNGAAGDRVYAVIDQVADGPISARALPRLLSWSAAYRAEPADPADPPLPDVRAPDGRRFQWTDPELAYALAEDLGRPVGLRREPRGQHDQPGTIFVTTERTRRAVEKALGGALDIRRFRTNLHLTVEGPAFMEEGWEGSRLTVDGGPTIRLGQPCDRCSITTHEPERPAERRREVLTWLQLHRGALFGIRGHVEVPGSVSAGDAVSIETP